MLWHIVCGGKLGRLCLVSLQNNKNFIYLRCLGCYVFGIMVDKLFLAVTGFFLFLFNIYKASV